jgi:hypothetical protein
MGMLCMTSFTNSQCGVMNVAALMHVGKPLVVLATDLRGPCASHFVAQAAFHTHVDLRIWSCQYP